MEFTVLKTKVKISPLFFAVLTAFLIADRGGTAAAVIGFSFLHELSHFAALAAVKKAPREVRITAAGISMRLFGMSTAQRIFVFAAGAAANLAAAAFFAAAGNRLFCAVNLAIGAFTMLPLCSTDGGSIAAALAESFFPERAEKLCRTLFAICGTAAAALLFAAAVLYKNPYLLIAVFYAVICLLNY